MKPPKRGVDEHVALGNRLKDATSAIATAILSSRTNNCRASRAARRVEAGLLSVKAALDSEVFALVPREQDPRDLAGKVYYGPQLVPRKPADPADAFDLWERSET